MQWQLDSLKKDNERQKLRFLGLKDRFLTWNLKLVNLIKKPLDSKAE